MMLRVLAVGAMVLVGACASTPVNGHPQCATDKYGVHCSTLDAQRKYDEDSRNKLLAEAQKRWRQSPKIQLERDPHYSLLPSPNMKVLSDGTELWTYIEGGECTTEETGGSKTARVLHAMGTSLPRQERTDCNTTSGSDITCTTNKPATPPPVPEARFERVCKNPARVSQFFIKNNIIEEARITTPSQSAPRN